MKRTKIKPDDAETVRIFPKDTERQNRPGKTYQTFVSEMMSVSEGADPRFIPLDFAGDPEKAERILAARRKKEEEDRQNANFKNATSFHKGWSKEQKIKGIMAGSPGMSREEAAKKASLRIGKQKHGISEEEKKDRYEGQESTKSMIARLVARRHRKLGMKVPADVEHDIDSKYKTKED